MAVNASERASGLLMDYFRRSELDVEAKGENDPVTEADRGAESAILEIVQDRFPTHAFVAEEGGRRPPPLRSTGPTGSSGSSQPDESVDPDDSHEWEWIVDPLDGTNNFLQGLPVFCTSIACRHRGEVVVAVVEAPALGDRFTAVAGGGARWNGRPMSVSARSGLEGAFLATGFPFHARAAVDRYLDAFRAAFLRCRAIRRCGSAALDLAYTAAGVFDGFFEYRLSPWDIAAGTLLVSEAGGEVSDLDGTGRPLDGGNVVAGSPGVWRELVDLVGRHADEEEIDRLVPLEGAALS